MKPLAILTGAFTAFVVGAIAGGTGVVLYAMYSISKATDDDMSIAWAGPFRPAGEEPEWPDWMTEAGIQ